MKKHLRKQLMRFLGFLVLCSVSAFTVNAQIIENALDFDNIDDDVQAPNASALIANSTQITLTLWVKPMNTAISFPDYDGFGGIRNNTNADFYIVHFGPRRVEARFRNSAGVAFDVIDTSIQIGQWQHYALTYNGSELTLYRNGQLVGSIPANGTITNTTLPFYVGNMPYQTVFYWMNGQLDEVTLWNRFLTGNEVNCVYQFGADPSALGLQLYYKCNQGTPGGINTSVASLTDATGHINGTFNGFSLSGSTSNFVNGVATVTDISDVICPGSSYTFGTQTLNSPGVYTEVYSSQFGCDSTVRLSLTSAVDNTVSVSGSVLTANQAGATYQWIDCNNGNQPVSGATSQSYDPAVNGSYAVEVTSGSCTATSSCVTVTTAGVDEAFNNSLSVYPNPVRDQLTVELPQSSAQWSVTVTDASGRIVAAEKAINGPRLTLQAASWAKGIYTVTITSGTSTAVRMVTR